MLRSIKGLFAVLAIPVLAASCGGLDDLIGADGGNNGACPVGTTLFKAQSGNYVISKFTTGTDDCKVGAMLNGEVREVINDANGNVTVKGSAASMTNLGVGAVRCNVGTLAETSSVLDPQTGCAYTRTRASAFTLTADNTFTLSFSESRKDLNDKCGLAGNPTTCTTTWTGVFTKQ